MGFIDVVYVEYRLFYGEVIRRKSALITMIMYPYLLTGFTVFMGFAYGNPRVFVGRTGVDPVLFMITASYMLLAFMSSIDELFWRPISQEYLGIQPYVIASPINRLLYYIAIPLPRLTTVILIGLTSLMPVHFVYKGLEGLAASLSIMVLTILGSLLSISFSITLTGLMHLVGESWRILNIIRPLVMILIGAYVPRIYLPFATRLVSYAIPASYVVDIIHNMLRGETVGLTILLAAATALFIIYTPVGYRSIVMWEKRKVKNGVKIV